MDFKIEKLAYDEIGVDIKRIIQQCIINFKWILVCALVLAITLPLLIYAKEKISYRDTMEIQNEDLTEIELTEEEQRGIDKYVLYDKRVKQLEEYEKNAIAMKIDFCNAYSGELQFYIDANENIDGTLATSIANYLASKTFLDAFADKTGVTAVEYVSEVIEITIADEDKGLIYIRVWCANEVECKEYIEALIDIAFEYAESIKEDVGEYELTLMQNTISCGYSISVFARQQTFYSNYDEAIGNFKDSERNLSNAQKIELNNMGYDFEIDEQEDNEPAFEPKIQIKYVIFGSIIGLILGIVCIVLLTIFDGKLQNEQEMYKRFGVTYFGSLYSEMKVDGKKSKLVFLDSNKMSIDEQIELLYKRIQFTVCNMNFNEVYVISTREEVYSESMQQLLNKLKNNNIDCKVRTNVDYHEIVTREVLKDKNVILVETIGKSKIKDVYEEAMACKAMEAQVVGYICMR